MINAKRRKLISFVVCFIFTATNTVSAFSPMGIEMRPTRETPSYLQIEIPKELATVEDVYEAPAKLDPRLVLHIQDAHGNYEAQVKIKKLLNYLHDTYNFELLFVEGAAEELNSNYLKLFPDQEQNVKLADNLAQKGQLTGAEYYMMDAPEDVKAIGIEETKLYRGNYEAFKAVSQHKVGVEAFMGDIESKLDMLSSRYFSADTRRLLSEWKKFHQGSRDFLPYVKQLSREANKILGLDLESLFAQVEWPQITRLLVLQSMESELNREQALKERDLLVQYLKKQGVSEAVIDGIQRLEEKRISINRLMPQGEGLEYLPRHLLERLVEEAGPKGFQFYDYPAFSLYAGYLILQSELESRILFEEIERLFKKVLDELTVSEDEKDLLELYRDEELLKKLLNLELSSGEWARAFYRREWIQPEVMLKRLQAVGERMTVSTNHQFGPKSMSTRMEMQTDIPEIYNVAFNFYDFARQREAVFYQKIKQEMVNRKIEKAVLITGGFHTDGLMQLFEEDEVSYGILTPAINQIQGKENYVATMLENHPTMFDLAQLQIINFLQSWDTREALGVGNKAAELVRLLDEYFRIARFKNSEDMVRHFNALNESGYAQDRKIRLELSPYRTELFILIDDQYLAAVSETDKATHKVTIPLKIDMTTGVVTPVGNIKLGEVLPASVPGFMIPKNVKLATEGAQLATLAETLAKQAEQTDETILATTKRIATQAQGNLVRSESEPGIQQVLDQIRGTQDVRRKIISGMPPPSGTSQVPASTVIVAGLAGGIVKIEPTEPQLAANALEAIATQMRSESRVEENIAAKFPVLFGGEEPGVATLVLDDLRVAPEDIVKVGEMLAAVGKNQFLNLVVVSGTKKQKWADKLVEQAKKQWAKEKLPADDIAERLKIQVMDPQYAYSKVSAIAQESAIRLFKRLKSLKVAVIPSIATLARDHSAMLVPQGYESVNTDLFQGQLLQSTIEESPGKILMAKVMLAVRLSRLNKSPVALSELTEAALKQLEALENEWSIIPENFANYVKVIETALSEFRSQLRTAASA